MPDRALLDADAGHPPSDENLQQLVEAERGMGTQGILRRWLASDSTRVVLTSDATGVKISRDNGSTAPAQVVVDGTAAGGDLSGTYPSPTLSAAIVDALLPPGTIQAYAGTGWPTGWLPCRGEIALRSQYAKLFAVIGTTYNTGGEAGTEFRLPDLQGRVVLGVSSTHGLATGGGTETGAVHTHTGSHSHGSGTLAHTLSGHTHLQGTHTHDAGSHSHDIAGHTHALTDHAHGPGSHQHDISGHTHLVNLDHNHALASGVAVASGAVTGVHEGPSAAVNVSANGHAHDVDLPALGLTNSTSGGTDAGHLSTGTPSLSNSGGLTVAANTGTSGAAGFASTGTPSAVTGGVTSGAASVGAPSSDTTGTSSGTTATDSSAPAASYTSTEANLPRYLTCMWIIRAG